MIIKQISIFIENKTGRIAEITNLLAKNEINLRALAVADTSNFGILRIIVEDAYRAEKILKDKDIPVSVTSVVSICIADKPGGLAEILKKLAEYNIGVEYMYAFVSKEIGKAYAIMRIEEDLRALEILKNAGYTGLDIE